MRYFQTLDSTADEMTWNALEKYCLIVNGYSLSELVQGGLMQ